MLITRMMIWNIRSTYCLLWVILRLKQDMLCSSITMFLVSSYVCTYVQYTHSCTHVLSYTPLDKAIPYLLNPPTVVLSNDPMKAVHKPIISPPSLGTCMRFYQYVQAKCYMHGVYHLTLLYTYVGIMKPSSGMGDAGLSGNNLSTPPTGTLIYTYIFMYINTTSHPNIYINHVYNLHAATKHPRERASRPESMSSSNLFSGPPLISSERSKSANLFR